MYYSNSTVIVMIPVILLLFTSGTLGNPFMPKIIGGDVVNDFENYNYMVQITNYMGAHLCGGVLYKYNVVITAAHCLVYQQNGRPREPKQIKVIAGQKQRSSKLENESIYRNVSNITIHDTYEHEIIKNDIALLLLQNPFDADNVNISLIELGYDWVENSICFISGWGDTGHGNISETLKLAEVQAINYYECDYIYNNTLEYSMLCATWLSGGACKGDSGGGLLCDGKLIGIVSTGAKCTEIQLPGVYTNVPLFREWLLREVAKFENRSQKEGIENIKIVKTEIHGLKVIFEVEWKSNLLNIFSYSLEIYISRRMHGTMINKFIHKKYAIAHNNIQDFYDENIDFEYFPSTTYEIKIGSCGNEARKAFCFNNVSACTDFQKCNPQQTFHYHTLPIKPLINLKHINCTDDNCEININIKDIQLLNSSLYYIYVENGTNLSMEFIKNIEDTKDRSAIKIIPLRKYNITFTVSKIELCRDNNYLLLINDYMGNLTYTVEYLSKTDINCPSKQDGTKSYFYFLLILIPILILLGFYIRRKVNICNKRCSLEEQFSNRTLLENGKHDTERFIRSSFPLAASDFNKSSLQVRSISVSTI